LPSLDFRISGVDRSFEVIDFAKENIRYAGLDKDIDLYSMAFEDYNPEVVPSMIVTNPPYGGRITDDDLFLLYKNLGDAFKKKYPGCTAWVLTANKEASHKIGLHPTRKIPLFNGAMECRFLRYIMYSGSKKTGITTEQVKEN
jgi:putative N6-adenine-specific DNA methylase